MVTGAVIALSFSVFGFGGRVGDPAPGPMLGAPAGLDEGLPCDDGGFAAPGGCGGCRGGYWSRCGSCVHCVNNLPQHFPYLNPYKGYYFFRPYNYTMIGEQQQMIEAMNGNQRAPYDNRFFERIYREVEAMPSATPTPTPLPAPPPLTPVVR